MIKKLTLITGVGVGYVLGSKAGRKRYDDLVAQFRKLTGTPQAQKVSETLHAAAGDLADKATTAAGVAAGTVKDKAIDLIDHGTSSSAPAPSLASVTPATPTTPKAAPTTSTTAPVNGANAPR